MGRELEMDRGWELEGVCLFVCVGGGWVNGVREKEQERHLE